MSGAARLASRGLAELEERCAAVVARLEEAGSTLLALRGRVGPSGVVVAPLEIVRSQAEAYGWSAERVRPAVPSAEAISRMDEAYAWLALLPQRPEALRLIVGLRSLVHPVSGRHLVSWRACGRRVGCDHKTAQAWHGEGVRRIAISLAHAPQSPVEIVSL